MYIQHSLIVLMAMKIMYISTNICLEKSYPEIGGPLPSFFVINKLTDNDTSTTNHTHLISRRVSHAMVKYTTAT